MLRPLLRVSLFVMLLASAAQLRAQQSFLRNITYEDRNPVDPRPIKLASIHGRAQDHSQAVIPNLLIGLFTEKSHRLVATVSTDDKGLYEFPQIPPGRYRIVAKLPGFCTANVPVRVTSELPLIRWQRSVELHMSPGGIDRCSFGATD